MLGVNRSRKQLKHDCQRLTRELASINGMLADLGVRVAELERSLVEFRSANRRPDTLELLTGKDGLLSYERIRNRRSGDTDD